MGSDRVRIRRDARFRTRCARRSVRHARAAAKSCRRTRSASRNAAHARGSRRARQRAGVRSQESGGCQTGQDAAPARSDQPRQIRHQPQRQAGRLQHAGGQAAADDERMGRQGRRRSQSRAGAVGHLSAEQTAAGDPGRPGFGRGLGFGRRAQSRHGRRARRSQQRSGQSRHHVQALDPGRRPIFADVAGQLFGHPNRSARRRPLRLPSR